MELVTAELLTAEPLKMQLSTVKLLKVWLLEMELVTAELLTVALLKVQLPTVKLLKVRLS